MRQGWVSDSPAPARCTLRRLVQRIYRHMPVSYQWFERLALSTLVPVLVAARRVWLGTKRPAGRRAG